MKEPEMVIIADLTERVLSNPGDSDTIKHVRDKVKALCSKFPVYEDIEI
jgi:glycine/serine hydroxymethyltransferase